MPIESRLVNNVRKFVKMASGNDERATWMEALREQVVGEMRQTQMFGPAPCVFLHAAYGAVHGDRKQRDQARIRGIKPKVCPLCRQVIKTADEIKKLYDELDAKELEKENVQAPVKQ